MSFTFLGLEIKGDIPWVVQQPDHAKAVLVRTDTLFRAFVRLRGGEVLDSETGAPEWWARFSIPQDALEAASLIREALYEQLSPASTPLAIGIALHAGEESVDGEEVKERCEALLAAVPSWQVLLSEQFVQLTAHSEPNFRPEPLGQHLLSDLRPSLEVYRLGAPKGADPRNRILSLTTLPNNLPTQLTSFIGRKNELAEIKRLLNQTRLLTIYGPGGCGKTRLALHAAVGLLTRLADGVWFVDFTSLRDATLIPQAVAAALALALDPSRPLKEALLEQLQEKRLLLLLDNCEHLAEACSSFIVDVLRKCPHVRLLVTSREVLHVPGETEWLVPPLTYPGAQESPSSEELFRYDAIRLFLDRARSRLPSWQLESERLQLLAQVCHRLDGLPLAIELLVPALKVRTMERIVGQLGNVLTLLGNGYGIDPRHRSMRASLDWSHDLLQEPEKRLLRRLSVFVGGATLDAITGVCSGNGVSERRVPELLIFLLDKSLLDVSTTAWEARYSLKEVIRQYAAEKLEDADEEAETYQRHRDWFLRFAKEADSNLVGPDESNWLNHLDTEYSNLRAALIWSQTSGDVATLFSLVTALSNFWYQRGYLQEGRQWFEVALKSTQVSPPMRANLLRGEGRLATVQGDFDTAISCFRESLELSRLIGDEQGAGVALNNLGAIALSLGEYDSSRTYLEEALVIQRRRGDTRKAANILNNLGGCALGQGDLERAITLYNEAINIWREAGDRFKVVDSLDNLGVIARLQGDFTKALELLHEALAIRTELGDQSGIPKTMSEIAKAHADQGRYSEARALLEKSLVLHRAVGSRLWEAITLVYLGSVLRLEADFEAAEPLLHESCSLFQELDGRVMLGECLNQLGHLARHRGEYTEAENLYRQGLEIFQKCRTKLGTSESLSGLSDLAADRGDLQQALDLSKQNLTLVWELKAYPSIAETLGSMARAYRQLGFQELAAQLTGGEEAIRGSIGTPIAPVLQRVSDEHLAELRKMMGSTAFESARQAGARTPVQDLVRLAMNAKSSRAYSNRPVIEAKLTPREAEVIRLVAKGFRDQEIAKQLVISPRTVEVHVRNMLEKAGVPNRAALVSWALQQGTLLQ